MKRVLILSASAGAGHVRAAEAIEKALVKYPQIEVRHEDALRFTNAAFRRVYSRAYINMVNRAPQVLGLLYDWADKPWKDERQRLAFDRFNTLPLISMLNRHKPDLVICTHFLPSEIMSWLICRKKIATKNAVVVTDFDIHSMWLCHHYFRYFVAMDETWVHLTQLGFSPDRVVVSGIPVDPVFAIPKNKQDMRAKYGLDPDLPTIYMSLGGHGVGPTEEIVMSLSQMQHEAQVLAMCGRNDELVGRLRVLGDNLAGQSKLKIHPVGFTTHVDEYMSASDMVLGKPGGLTTSEALCKALAFVIVNPIPGQEERNADHLLEEGVGIRCNNLPALAYKVDNLLGDKERLGSMKENALRMSHPDAADIIVDNLLTNASQSQAISNASHRCATIPERAVRATRRATGSIVSKLRPSRRLKRLR
ncbi:MAG: hypothetical protein K2X93_11255 [Candidatus Obscuribacterales bacterium]|nr:hypothetical protein [Candidatus Obscuribacterales bacterium]